MPPALQIHGERGQILHFGAGDDFADRAFRARCFAFGKRRQRSEFGVFQTLCFDIPVCQMLAHIGVFDGRAVSSSVWRASFSNSV